jgi:hypothetical protein
MLGPDDPGLDGFLAAAKAAGVPAAEFARQYLAVMFGWNALSDKQLGLGRIQRIRLLEPVYGFHGRARPQRNDRYPTQRSPVAATPGWLRGGAIQAWIPNLTSRVMIGTAVCLVG